MDYSVFLKKEQVELIIVVDMIKFVVDYISFDQLGVIDNAYKVLVDVEEGGVEFEICLYLVELYFLVVDAFKIGKWFKMSKMESLEKYFDFMMKFDKVSYFFDKLLGKFYRRCRKFKDTASERYCQKMRVDSSFLLLGYVEYIEEVREVYERYCIEMEVLMRL